MTTRKPQNNFLLAFLCLFFSNYLIAQVEVLFNIPSGATAETSRTYEDIVTQFNWQHKDITIELVPTNNWDWVVSKARQQAKKRKSSGIIVAQLSETLELADGGTVIPLDRIIANQPDFLKTFHPSFFSNSFGSDGALYGLPFLRSTPMMYYNLDMLNCKLGITAADLPKTWKEFEQLCSDYKKAAPDETPFLMGGEWYEWLFETAVLQCGGALMDERSQSVVFDSPAAIEALNYWKSLKDKQLLHIANSWKATINSFVHQQFPIVCYSSGGLATAMNESGFQWTADKMPLNRENAVSYGGANLYLSTNMTPEEEAAAWKFVQFLYEPAVQAKIASESGFAPVIIDAAEDIVMPKALYEPAYRLSREQLGQAKHKFMTPNYITVRHILKKAIIRVLDDNVAPAQALQQAQTEAQNILNNLKKN